MCTLAGGTVTAVVTMPVTVSLQEDLVTNCLAFFPQCLDSFDFGLRVLVLTFAKLQMNNKAPCTRAQSF